MPTKVVHYRVFLASPGGLDREREVVRAAIEEYNDHTATPHGVRFVTNAWEEVPAGAGRSQDLINPMLEESDLSIFLLADRWGSSSGSGSGETGTEEEYRIAQSSFKSATGKMRSIAIYFKKQAPERLADRDPQLQKIVKFRDHLNTSKECHYKEFRDEEELRSLITRRIAAWFLKHETHGEIPVDGGDTARASSQENEFLKFALADNLGSGNHFAKQVVEKFKPGQAIAYGRFLRDTGNIKQAIAVFESVERRAAQHNNDIGRADAFGELGSLYRSTGDVAVAEQMHREALKINRARKNLEGVAINLGNFANLMLGTERYVEAREMYEEAISINTDLENEFGLAGNFGGLAMVMTKLGKFLKPKKLYLRSIELHFAFNNQEGAASSTFNLGSLFQTWNRLDEAEEQFNAALEINQRIDRKYGISLCIGALGLIRYQRALRTGDKDDLRQAEKSIRQGLEIQEALRDMEATATAYGNLAIVLRELNEFDEAETYFGEAIQVEKSLTRSSQVARNYREWAGLLDRKSDSAGAAEKRRLAKEYERRGS